MLPEVSLFEHQKKSIEFYGTHNYCLNGSEAGTGKTLPAMAILEKAAKGLVVCPAFLCRNWRAELKKFTGLDSKIYPEKGKITLISADQIHKDATLFHNLDALVVDECHLFCNVKTRRSLALHTYVKDFKPKKLILMSGTPMRNRIPELYSLLMLIEYGNPRGFKNKFPNPWTFNLRYSNPVEKRFGGRRITQFEGIRNLPELREWLKDVYFRYRLTELADIPNVMYEDVEAEVEDLVLCDTVLNDGWESMVEFNSVPSHISSAKLESAAAKVPFTIEFCKHLLESDQGPLVIFSDHVSPAKEIAEGLGTPLLIHGGTSMGDRDRFVNYFQAGKYPVLVGTIGAMGTGLTLTASSVLVRNDLSWIPAMNSQAVGRIRRIGQKHTCRVIDVTRAGVDTKIARLLKAKEKIISQTL